METETTIGVRINCGGMLPPAIDTDDAQGILETVRAAFVDPDPGDVFVTLDFYNDGREDDGREPDLRTAWMALNAQGRHHFAGYCPSCGAALPAPVRDDAHFPDDPERGFAFVACAADGCDYERVWEVTP